MKSNKSSSLSIQAYREYLKKYSRSLTDESRQRLVGSLYIIFTLFTVSFFGVFAINPTVSTISGLQKQYQESVEVEKKLQTKLDALRQLDIQYAQLQPDLGLVFAAIPTSAKIATLTRQLEKLTLSRGLGISRLDFRTIELFPGKKINDPIYSYSFSIGLQGSENNTNNFIQDLINLDRIISIDNITTDKENQESGVSIIGRAFFYKE